MSKEQKKPKRIAKMLARAGVASRREVERMILAGRVHVNGKVLTTPAFLVTGKENITVDGKTIAAKQAPRLWRYHKPVGLLTTNHDPGGRPTVFENLPKTLPRVITVGRLDMNSEGLLLLTNDGELARKMELPQTGFARRYRARAFGKPAQAQLDTLTKGVEIDGVRTGPIVAVLDKQQGTNAWISITIREGKNREIRRALETLDLKVNRLIRLSYGPFSLAELKRGAVEEVKPRILQDQLGHFLDFDHANSGVPKSKTGAKTGPKTQHKNTQNPRTKPHAKSRTKQGAKPGGPHARRRR